MQGYEQAASKILGQISKVIYIKTQKKNHIITSIMYKTPTHVLFHSTLYYSSVLISLKYTKIFNSTPTCFDLKRSSSGSMTYLAKITELFKRLEEFLKH